MDVLVTIKMTVGEMDLIREALHDSRAEHKDLIDDPVVKQEDKQEAAKQVFALDDVLRKFEGR